ncbi:MAG: hypothetical protein IJZ79_03395 [Bacilli bacterium]|nr:hypothetical protein [Bacilli bacterium]MBQ8218773.1 hypothetical protein [Bacilli bacterium]
MTKTEFINELDFEAAKVVISKKLGMKAEDLSISSTRSGDFKINLKNISGKLSALFYGARKAILYTDNIHVVEHKDNFSYEAAVWLNLKNGYGEYRTKIGKISLNNNKFVFSTIRDIRNRNKSKNEENQLKTEIA